ncbi:hypothetical protein [Sphingomonas sp. Leaf339]|uniref:hypothetical protein n=1 Tax=Sphingomonas sp. Leaf339 TaxID=1736343 RepID=UPI000A4EEBCA|nr:hypothetical protein [Sphingomonas sp. Leaf339]
MTTPKTRFLISQKQTEKQIFSVEERRSGDLLIGFTPPKAIKIAGRITERPRSRKVSVHLSLMSDPPVHTITHEIGFGLRASHKGYAVVRRLKNQPFIWPILCQSFGTHEPKFIHRRKADEIRRIGAYDSSIDCLLVGVFVTHSSYAIPESHGLSVTIKRFSKFNLNVVTTFADIKSGKSTLEIFNYTSPVKDGDSWLKLVETPPPILLI